LRLLADENVPGAVVAALRMAGHDIAWVRADAPGQSDGTVHSRAIRERRILVTFDKDFGELARHVTLPAGCGVVLLRVPMSSAAAAAVSITAIIGSRQAWAGHFSTVEPGRIRMRRLAIRPDDDG
jgi:predicted nuclease of predicted toxin-antitoxin system